MKYQKSSFPYLFIVCALVVGLPILDAILNYESKITIEIETDESTKPNADLLLKEYVVEAKTEGNIQY